MAWETEENVYGPETPFEATVKSPNFDYDPEYREGEVLLLNWNLEDISDPEWEEFTLRFPLGKEWDTNDGKVAENLQGKDKFNSQSFYGRIINRVIGKESEYTDDFKGAYDVLAERGDPTNAGVWEGLRFRFDAEEFEFNFKDGARTVTRIMPVAFLGEEGKSNKKGGGKKKTKEPTKEAVEERLKELAAESEDHDEFVKMAGMDSVASKFEQYEDLSEAVMDEDNFFAEHG